MLEYFAMPLLHLVAGMMVLTSAGIYGFRYLGREIGGARSFWKTAPVFVLAGFTLLIDVPALLSVALLLCALGDFFLSRGNHHFVSGLVAFLAGHLVYITLFLSLNISLYFNWLMLALVVYSAVFSVYMWSRTDNYRWPVLMYIAVITVMVGVSFMLPAAYYLIIIGTIVFVISDSILAVRMFVITDKKVKLVLSWCVWVSYILGQSLIVIGALQADQLGFS